jgi:hypothetical protein
VRSKRKLLLAAVAFVSANLFGSTALAFAPVGPPTASLKTEQWSLGLDYAHSEIDFEIEWKSDYASGIPDSKATDMESEVYLARYRYGVNEDFEFCWFLGASDLRGTIDTDEYDSDFDFNGGFGFKWTFLKDQDGVLSWGLAYQMDWMLGDDNYIYDLTTYGYGIQEADVDFDSFDIFIALGPTLKMGGLSLYGGVAFYYFDADFEIEYANIKIIEGNVDEEMLGGYGGATIDLGENNSIYAEYVYSEDAWVMGGGIVFKF